MEPEEIEQAIRESVGRGSGLEDEWANYLLARYDEAVVNQNANAAAIVDLARTCREARHVAELFIALLKIIADEREQAGLKHLLQVLEGHYAWLIAHRGPQK